MAFHVYNTKQQALNAQKLAELFSFTSNDFAGLISSEQSPIVISNNSWSWNTNLSPLINFIGGGINIDFDFPQDSNEYTFGENNLYGIDVIVPSDTSSISTDIYNLVHIVSIKCEDISVNNIYTVISNPTGSPSVNGYYEYIENQETHQGEYILSEDSQVDTSKVYYYEIEDGLFTVEGAEFNSVGNDSSSTLSPQTFSYYGNTIWIDKSIGRFFIPICGKDKDGNIISLIFNRDKAGYESFLSARTYYSLLKELSNKFVFRVGGRTLGDIGQLNVTDNNITNRTGGTVNIESAYLNNIPVMSDSSMSEKFEKNTNIPVDRYRGLLMVGSDTVDSNNSLAKQGRIYRISDDYKIPIKHGGTAAADTDSARKNLNFYSVDTKQTPVNGSTTDPTKRTVNPKKEDGTPDYGALWFKIIE